MCLSVVLGRRTTSSSIYDEGRGQPADIRPPKSNEGTPTAGPPLECEVCDHQHDEIEPVLAGDAGQCCICKFISSAGGIRLLLKSNMIHSDPATTMVTMSTPNASASTLLVLSGPVVMCRKNTRWTPIWAMARTARPRGMPRAQSRDVLATQNDVAVRITDRTNPIV